MWSLRNLVRRVRQPGFEYQELNPTLHGWQIYFIVLSAVIGGGIFNNNGLALELAGPAGLITAIIAVGLLAIIVGECVAELVQQFPIYNAIVEYVRVFVDEDLAWVVGIAYWYCFASIFAIQNITAAGLSDYWDTSSVIQILAFYLGAPVVIFVINCLGVFAFGVVETIGGILKVCLVLGTSFVLYAIAGGGGDGTGRRPINDGYQHNAKYITNNSMAVCYAIPIVAYGYLGIEIFAVTAFEARNGNALRRPSQIMAYTVMLFYFVCTIGETLNVPWDDSHLSDVFTGLHSNPRNLTNPSSSSVVIIAFWKAKDTSFRRLSGFMNGCLIFSALSAANTSLYVASRTLYGLTREIKTSGNSNLILRLLKTFSLLDTKTKVPIVALFVSIVSFIWLPFLQAKGAYEIEELVDIIAVSASVACLIGWAALCLAFLRYSWWLKICEPRLRETRPQYVRSDKQYKGHTALHRLLPGLSMLGFAGCIMVLAFASASWWSSTTPENSANFGKVSVAYAAPICCFALFLLLKLFNRRIHKRWWVRMDPDATVLIRELDRLTRFRPEERVSRKQRMQQPGVLTPGMANGGSTPDRTDTSLELSSRGRSDAGPSSNFHSLSE